ncbi:MULTISPECIES: IS110 family transposase [unclassified Rubrivivax]|uniref:IS110 family transposase n=1 Tax=unclassified Rubrivivax TaxID=2649762 RepID=UPI001E5540EB|nr:MULTISPECIES: IS110 family transposase [unclassified Rubrivivax]MCC9595326.1 IS110 family transposase [Rubrivivax sp. JA1055]MCC9647167.1 IS110 family transposase [Rubrivivax sp. JA1029]
MTILFLGIDLAKNVFALHGVDERGKPALLRPAVRRDQLLEAVAKLPPCTIGMEACSGAHHWARRFQEFGHTVRLMAPKFVVPYRMSGRRGKNDAADAAAIREALQRPAMRFVPVKSTQAQSRLAVHTARQGWVSARTAVINRLRGVLSEFGIVLPLKAATVRSRAGEQLDTVPGWVQTVCRDLLAELQRLDERVAAYDEHIRLMAQADDRARALMAMPGIGPTTASALLASIGYGHDFANGRQLAAWMGLAPGQYSSGGKNRLGRITKAGDAYLRTLFIMGARAVLAAAANKHDRLSRWATALAERRGYWKAVVAIAAKNVRMAWAMLAKGEEFKPMA